MKIGIYLKNFPPDKNFAKRSMGALKYVDGIAKGFASQGADVSVLCERDKTTTIEADYITKVFKKSKSKNPFSLSLEFKEYLRVSNFDICLLFGMFHSGGYAVSRHLIKADIPYVFCPMDPYNDALFSKGLIKKFIYWNLFEKRLIHQSAMVELFNGVHEDFITSRKVYPKCYTTALAVADDEVPTSTKDWDTPSDTIKIMFQGRIDIQNKGLDLLVKAFSEVTKTHNNVELIMQGYPQDNQQLEKLIASLNMSDKISILEPDFSISAPEAILKNSTDLFCLSSRFEGFSFAVVEAMLLELPVIVTSFAGVAPFVKESEGGYVVDSTVDGIKDGILKAISEQTKWPTMGKKGRKYVLETLQWNNIAKQNLCIYKDFLDS